jgi:hypothetical protein
MAELSLKISYKVTDVGFSLATKRTMSFPLSLLNYTLYLSISLLRATFFTPDGSYQRYIVKQLSIGASSAKYRQESGTIDTCSLGCVSTITLLKFYGEF